MQGGNSHQEVAVEHAFSGPSVPGGSVLEGKPVSVPSEPTRQQVTSLAPILVARHILAICTCLTHAYNLPPIALL